MNSKNIVSKFFIVLALFIFGIGLIWYNSNWKTALGVFIVAGSYNLYK